jgi:hypothetical protein
LTSNKINTDLQEIGGCEDAIERAKLVGKWNEERRAMLHIYAPMYLQTITEETKNFLAAGGTQERLDDITQNYPANTILYLLAELWNLQEQNDEAKDPKEDRFLSVMVFSDLPQETLKSSHARSPTTKLGLASCPQ